MLFVPNMYHGEGGNLYLARRRWDYFVQYLLGVTPPAEMELKEKRWASLTASISRTALASVESGLKLCRLRTARGIDAEHAVHLAHWSQPSARQYQRAR
jgi:hypothetical protein